MSGMTMVEDVEAHEELARALSRGLQLDTQRSSRDSLQCSSGYSTQTTTPCCSEDTIPSQVSDYDYFSVGGDQDVEQQQQDFDKSSTIPRNSDISQSYRRMFQAKRPASTAGLPSTGGPVIVTPGVATIRRTPSTKPSVRRAALGAGPIPIRTPVVPVRTPTVPDFPAGGPYGLGGPGGGGGRGPDEPRVARGRRTRRSPARRFLERPGLHQPPCVAAAPPRPGGHGVRGRGPGGPGEPAGRGDGDSRRSGRQHAPGHPPRRQAEEDDDQRPLRAAYGVRTGPPSIRSYTRRRSHWAN
ncbi:hypothetical protein AAFF_G00044310 [Aldrovandia affinis]|uniref:Uncharacterized protein n=1 Tax=Aldrovandia affinis TaxID=143900 RepID=A0AAD7S2B2_9TELE|nr:hypothetical protein AAFF_G00044310 [Aldrovandia affinis]